MNPVHKFNNGNGATLCNYCSTIICTGFTNDLLCKTCSNMTKRELMEQMYLQARKEGNTVSISCLGTMKGEIENILKTSKETPDTLIEKYAVKSKKALQEFKPKDYEKELEILELFLPKLKSEEDLRSVIREIVNNNPTANIGQLMGICMKNLKGEDGNTIKKLVTELSSK